MFVKEESKFELGADAVGSGNENGSFHSGDIKFKKSAETADIGANSGSHGSCDVLFHKFNSFVACGDINTGCCVAVRSGIVHNHYSFPFQQ